MSSLEEIITTIENFAPLSLADEYDTPGLHTKDNLNKQIKKVLVCLTVTMDILLEAKNNNCDMVISHHPAIFGAEILDKFTSDIVSFAKENNITLYSAHTNLDASNGGINDVICDMLNISVENIDKPYRFGKFKNEITLDKLKDKVELLFKDKHVKTIGKLDKSCLTVCVSSGAGARDDELIELANDRHVDVFIGGEGKLSNAEKMRYYDIACIEFGHYESEIICKNIFVNILKNIDVLVCLSTTETSPYNE